MARKPYLRLSNRERQIMDLVLARGSATVTEVREGLADPPSYSAVRATMRILEEKSHLRHKKDGPRYVYFPTQSPRRARNAALKQMVQNLFEGSPEKAFAALLDVSEADLDPATLARLGRMVEQARTEGR